MRVHTLIFNFSKFQVIKSEETKPITSLSPFIIEKQIESLIGTPESVKKLKNELLLVETSRASQADSLLKTKKFFNMKASVSEHNSLNKSRGIVKDKTLKGEIEENIVEYLAQQGVIACKRFRIKKDNVQLDIDTLLLTFNTTALPQNIKIFYRTVPVEQFIPNPLRCFNCKKFGHHEDNCKLTDEVICDRCGESKLTSIICQRPFKCVNCGKEHSARSTECEVWKREKEIMRIKRIRHISYFEAKKQYETSFEYRYCKLVQSAMANPQTRTCGTQYDPLEFKQDTKSSPKSRSSSVLNLKHLRQIQNVIKQKNLVDRDQLIDLVHALDHQISQKVNQIKKKKTNSQTDIRKGHKILLSWQIDMRI